MNKSVKKFFVFLLAANIVLMATYNASATITEDLKYELLLSISDFDIEAAKKIINENLGLVNEKILADNTPLKIAVTHPNNFDEFKDFVRFLISKGADTSDIIKFAKQKKYVQVGRKEKVIEFLEMEINGNTQLHYTESLQPQEFKELIKKFNIEAKNNNGQTPLHCAVINNDFQGVDNLLKAGANVHAQDNAGKKPIDYFISSDNPQIAHSPLIKQYLEAAMKKSPSPAPAPSPSPSPAPSPSPKSSKKKKTVKSEQELAAELNEAIFNNNFNEVKKILSKNPKLINVKAGTYFETPLIRLTSKSRTDDDREIFDYLMNINGIDINAVDRDDCNAIRYVFGKFITFNNENDKYMFKVLVEKNADVSKTCKDYELSTIKKIIQNQSLDKNIADTFLQACEKILNPPTDYSIHHKSKLIPPLQGKLNDLSKRLFELKEKLKTLATQLENLKSGLNKSDPKI